MNDGIIYLTLEQAKIMTAIMDGTYDIDEELKLEILNAIED